MNWDEIFNNIISDIILLIVSGIGGWFLGLFKGKKESTQAIDRKNKIYQPLITELEKYSDFNWHIREKVNLPFLSEIVGDSYKYGIDNTLQEQCDYLYNIVKEYNSINPIKIAHSIIADIFERGYSKIYGSIVEGISYYYDEFGNEWEEEVLVEPVQFIRQNDYSKEIESLLSDEGMPFDQVMIDQVNSLYEPIYSQLRIIYQSSLNLTINGEKYSNPLPAINLDMAPEEYIALNYDFFESYNNNGVIKKKYELQEEIVYTSQAIIQSLKEIISNIVKVYEVEDL